jgi:hypothetical protein
MFRCKFSRNNDADAFVDKTSPEYLLKFPWVSLHATMEPWFCASGVPESGA